MFAKAPIEIEAPLNRIYIFTRWYRGDDPFGENRLAFPPDRAFAMERLRRLANDSGGDPFNYRLYDVWQMVYQKPWTRPRNVDDLIRDLAEKIHRGELFVYERSAARHYTLISELHAEDAVAVRAEPESQRPLDRPRTQSVPDGGRSGQDSPATTPGFAGVIPIAAVGQAAATDSASPIAAEPPEPRVRVEAGVFFDGTGNNRGNIQRYPGLVEQCLAANEAGQISEDECSMEIAQQSGFSYLGAETNVSKLEQLYLKDTIQENGNPVHRRSVYISGVGTKTGDEDSRFSQGTGLGEKGVLNKADTGANELALEIQRLGDEKIDELVLDIFGFSRGAAIARHFVNEVIAAKQGILGIAFVNAGLDWPNKVTIRFLGIYDTVAAIVNLSNLDLSPGNNRNHPVNIDIATGSVDYIAHLTAGHERRQNFALNSLRDESGSLPPNVGEWMLPGVHSDIGGGYHDLSAEEVEVRPPMLVVSNEGLHQDTEDTFEYDLMSQQLADVKSEGWFGAHNSSGSLEIRVEGPENATPGQNGPHESLHLWMSREVRGEYSRIPLHLMRELAVRHGVPMNKITEQYPDMLLPDELSGIAAAIEAHVLEGAELELTEEQRAFLKQRYIHHSDHYEPLGPLFPHKAAPGHERAIYNKHGL